jgi:NAD-dependent oxidoreductase involved in siderophore biosynthesis
MTKLEEYTLKAETSLAAAESATSEQDRAFHRRAHTIWRKLMRGVGEAEERAAMQPPRKIRSEDTRPAAAKARA